MTAPTERTVLRPDNRWLDRDPIDHEMMFSHAFDPVKTAEDDAAEIVWRYAQEIKNAISG